MEGEPWTAEAVREMISNPIYVGLGQVPAIIELDLWVGAGVVAVKEIGLSQYLGLVYDNLRRWEGDTGVIPGLGTREEFIVRESSKIRRAVTRRSGIQAMIKNFQKQLAPS